MALLELNLKAKPKTLNNPCKEIYYDGLDDWYNTGPITYTYDDLAKVKVEMMKKDLEMKHQQWLQWAKVSF